MKRLSALFCTLVISCISVGQNINRLEYFIDTDPGYGLASSVPVTEASEINDFTFTVSLTSVRDGFHVLFLRARDSNDKWSLVHARPFIKISVPLTLPGLDRVEYFIDTDPGYGAATNVSFEAGEVIDGLTFTVALDAIADGFHTLYVRARDANNTWSVVHNRPFVKLGLSALVNISKLEYFIDTDPGYGNAVNIPFTPATSVNDLSFDVNVTGLSEGPHKLFLRSKDANNKWSLVHTKGFTICNQTLTVAAASAISTTSFTANWSAAENATGYRLDVSADDFASLVSGFNDKAVTGTSHVVTGLSAGTTYKYRLRAEGACLSVNSNEISVLTLPAAPAATTATAISANGFTANWNTVTSASAYQLDVSPDDFTTFATGYNGKVVTTNSEAVTGLIAGTLYRYRVRAVNATGVSSNSSAISASTITSAPNAIAATQVTATSFIANWDQATGALSYRLDVSGDNFSTLLPDYNDKLVYGTSITVTGLTPSTAYQYRVRATNSSGNSANSNAVDVTTAGGLSAPTATAATDVSTTGFTANWNEVSSATGYRLDVSIDNFTSFVHGYENKSVLNITEVVDALSPSTFYQYRVRAERDGETSPHSNVVNVSTADMLDQSVFFEAIATKTLGDPAFTLNATASSGLDVSFSTTSDKISISENIVTLLHAGRAAITASQAGNASYNAAPSVDQTFCINPPKPSITLSSPDTEAPILTSSAETGNQWFFNGMEMSGEAEGSITATAAGVYSVVVTIEGCVSEYSNDLAIIITGTERPASEDIKVYPNPVEDKLHTFLPGAGSKILKVLQADGRVVYRLETEAMSVEIHTADWAPGIYQLQVFTGKFLTTKKFFRK